MFQKIHLIVTQKLTENDLFYIKIIHTGRSDRMLPTTITDRDILVDRTNWRNGEHLMLCMPIHQWC